MAMPVLILPPEAPFAGGDDKDKERPNTTENWDTYNFEWLFDPDRYDHLPIDEQLKLYKQRDLKKVKYFKTACKIFGAPPSRKRIIIAPPMKTWKDDPGQALEGQQSISALKPQLPPPAMPGKDQLQEWKKLDKEDSYKSWVAERRSFRNNLENMGLSEQWLAGKSNKTALEKRVLARMLEEKYPKTPSVEPIEEPPKSGKVSESPTVQRPCPLAVRIIEEFLQKNRMRLIDLFLKVDKQKNWLVTRDEFRRVIKQHNIPISDVLLEDLILALDADLNNKLDYREMARGMGLWKKEKIEVKRRLIESRVLNHSPTKYSQVSGFETPNTGEAGEEGEEREEREEREAAESRQNGGAASAKSQGQASGAETLSPTPPAPRVKSALSTASSGSARLELPEADLREEQRIMSPEAMLDLRKHNREALYRLSKERKYHSRGPCSPRYSATSSAYRGGSSAGSRHLSPMILTGDSAVDSHVHPSTLEGEEIPEQVNKFRQDRLKEYHDIKNLCEANELPFTEEMIKRVFLYPGDKDYHDIQHKIRQPGGSLLSKNFAVAEKSAPVGKGKARVERQRRTAHKKRVGSGGRGRQRGSFMKGTGSAVSDDEVDVRELKYAYPHRRDLRPQAQKMRLSTGKTVVRTQVDCWMTFEDYERFTNHLNKRLRLEESDPNAIWPGQLLGKLRLMLDQHKPTDAIFHGVRQPPPVYKGYDNNLKTWGMSDTGYIQYGTIDK